MGHEIKVIG